MVPNLLICIVFFNVFASTSVITNKLNVKLESHTSKTSKQPEIDTSKFEAQVISETNKILIVNGHCSLVREFSLSYNFSFDCQVQYLPIDFKLKHHSGSETLLTAYLTSTNELQNRQEMSNICRKLRRYYFFTHHFSHIKMFF